VDLILRIGNDPASWTLPDASYDDLVTKLRQGTGPLVLPVTAPLVGSLVLSRQAAGNVVLLQPPGGRVWESTDWNPGHVARPDAPVIYLASPAGPAQGARYALSSNVNAVTAVQEIETAMANGTVLTFPVYDPSGTGLLVIRGASLPFAVVC
jgi:hypothetical protein